MITIQNLCKKFEDQDEINELIGIAGKNIDINITQV